MYHIVDRKRDKWIHWLIYWIFELFQYSIYKPVDSFSWNQIFSLGKYDFRNSEKSIKKQIHLIFHTLAAMRIWALKHYRIACEEDSLPGAMPLRSKSQSGPPVGLVHSCWTRSIPNPCRNSELCITNKHFSWSSPVC